MNRFGSFLENDLSSKFQKTTGLIPKIIEGAYEIPLKIFAGLTGKGLDLDNWFEVTRPVKNTAENLEQILPYSLAIGSGIGIGSGLKKLAKEKGTSTKWLAKTILTASILTSIVGGAVDYTHNKLSTGRWIATGTNVASLGVYSQPKITPWIKATYISGQTLTNKTAEDPSWLIKPFSKAGAYGTHLLSGITRQDGNDMFKYGLLGAGAGLGMLYFEFLSNQKNDKKQNKKTRKK